MAYGDGGFFFTQPVGNGYSGLGSMHLATRDNMYAKGLGPGSALSVAPIISLKRVLPAEESAPTLDPMMGPLPLPMPTLSPEQVEDMGLMALDDADLVETVSADVEEPKGLMGFFQQNMLVSAAIIGAVGFFGYRYAKRQGMIA